MPEARAHVIVSGMVQGVYFRDSARGRARELGLVGWVRNLPDGRVELLMEGQQHRLDQMVQWCREGPPHAVVVDAAVEWGPASLQFTDFTIARTPG